MKQSNIFIVLNILNAVTDHVNLCSNDNTVMNSIIAGESLLIEYENGCADLNIKYLVHQD